MNRATAFIKRFRGIAIRKKQPSFVWIFWSVNFVKTIWSMLTMKMGSYSWISKIIRISSILLSGLCGTPSLWVPHIYLKMLISYNLVLWKILLLDTHFLLQISARLFIYKTPISHQIYNHYHHSVRQNPKCLKLFLWYWI